MIRAVVADDQGLVRAGLRMILSAEPDIEVVGEAADGHEAVAIAQRRSPDVVLMDIRMPALDGIDATRQLMAHDNPPHVLVLTTFDLDEYVYEAMRAGASGFLLKSARPQQLVSAVRDAVAGETLLAPEITRRLVETFVRRPPPGTRTPPALEALTNRELEVLRHIACGRSNAEIAELLFVTDETVKTHASRIFMKLGLRDRIQAVILAYECGLVESTRLAARR